MAPVVTFDAGQTLVELDLDFLVRRLSERGVSVEVTALRGAAPEAWRRYDAAVDGVGHPWKTFMATLLAGAGVDGRRDELVEWLWTEQPKANLWRKPIPDMVALARELRAAGVIVGVLSNSEGTLADLLVEIGIADPFVAVVDSARVGIEKPDPAIFDKALEVLHAQDARVRVHIGDSWSADVEGALAAAWNAVWYGRRAEPTSDPHVAWARDAEGVRAALRAWGALERGGEPARR